MERSVHPLSREIHRRGVLPRPTTMADTPIAPGSKPSPNESNAIKVGLALVFLAVIVWFGQDAVVSLFRGRASNEGSLENMPPVVVCAPATQTRAVGQTVTLTASGGDPSEYTWYAPEGNPFNQSGAQASITYATPGQKSVVLVSKVRTAKCEITVTQ